MTQTKLKPLYNYIHIRKPRGEHTTESGIVLPEEEVTSEFEGKVISTGPDAKHVKSGDHVLYKQYSSNKVPDTKDEYLVKEDDILAIKL